MDIPLPLLVTTKSASVLPPLKKKEKLKLKRVRNKNSSSMINLKFM